VKFFGVKDFATSFQGSSLPPKRKYAGCGWSRAYLYKSNLHWGWVFDLILSTLSLEVTVALPYRHYFWKLRKLFVRDPAWPVFRFWTSTSMRCWLRGKFAYFSLAHFLHSISSVPGQTLTVLPLPSIIFLVSTKGRVQLMSEALCLKNSTENKVRVVNLFHEKFSQSQ